LKITESTKK